MTYEPRPGKVRGTSCIDAFDTSWRVRDRVPNGFQIEHEDDGWLFGIGNDGLQTAVRRPAWMDSSR